MRRRRFRNFFAAFFLAECIFTFTGCNPQATSNNSSSQGQSTPAQSAPGSNVAIALILGLLTPIAAFGLVCQMLGAFLLVYLPQGHPFVSQDGPSYELALIYLVMSIMLIFLGPGKWSLDAVLFARRGV